MIGVLLPNHKNIVEGEQIYKSQKNMKTEVRTNYYVVPKKSQRGVPEEKNVSEMEAKNAIKTGKHPFEVWPDNDSFHCTIEVEVDVYKETITITKL